MATMKTDNQKRQISILLPIKRQGDNLLVYLQKRSVDAMTLPDYFGFWGGGAEVGESAWQTLVREIHEEMGIIMEAEQVKLFNRYEFLKSVKYAYLFEQVANWEDSIVIGEGDYGQWFSTKEALGIENFIFEDKVIINDLERTLLNQPIR